MASILVVDDDATVGRTFQQFLTLEGHEVELANGGEEALERVAGTPPDLVLMDIRMPGLDGLGALRRMRETAPRVAVILMTAYGTSQTSIDAMRLGAFDYLMKPPDLDHLLAVIDRALETQRASGDAGDETSVEAERYALDNLVGKSQRMVEIYKLIGLLATNDVPALLVGERGTGKQLVAQTIHFNSGRQDRPFVAVECRALPDAALDAELFGREADAAAGGAQTGRVDAAAGGTLFLADLEAMAPAVQVRLGRFLKTGRMLRVGGVVPVANDVRLVAASEKDLADEVRRGAFSRELYDALAVMTITLPALRQRVEDIPDLVTHFIRRANHELNRAITRADDRVQRLLGEHTWPGNVAELEGVVKRACILARGDVLTPDDLGGSLSDTTLPGRQDTEDGLRVATRAALHERLIADPAERSGSVFREIVDVVEGTLVREALTVTGGNQVKASELIGVNRTTLRKKM